MNVFSIVIAVLIVAQVQTQVVKTPRQRYAELGAQLFSVSDPWGAKPPSPRDSIRALSPALEESYVRELHDVLATDISTALNSKEKPDAQQVKRAIDDLQGTFSLKFDNDLKHRPPFADYSETTGGPVVTVAFAILKDPVAIPRPEPFIQFYTRRGGVWELKAEAPRDLQNRWLEAATLPSPFGNEVWVLAWGKRYGDTGSRLYAYLYAFDGNTVRTVWRREGLVGGQLDIAGKRVTLVYYDTYPSKEPPVQEVLDITSDGLR